MDNLTRRLMSMQGDPKNTIQVGDRVRVTHEYLRFFSSRNFHIPGQEYGSVGEIVIMYMHQEECRAIIKLGKSQNVVPCYLLPAMRRYYVTDDDFTEYGKD